MAHLTVVQVGCLHGIGQPAGICPRATSGKDSKAKIREGVKYAGAAFDIAMLAQPQHTRRARTAFHAKVGLAALFKKDWMENEDGGVNESNCACHLFILSSQQEHRSKCNPSAFQPTASGTQKAGPTPQYPHPLLTLSTCPKTISRVTLLMPSAPTTTSKRSVVPSVKVASTSFSPMSSRF